jgi:hypothetical protein
MFGEGLFIGFYWGPRREGLNACTGRASRLLSGLQRCHPRLFSSWYRSFDFEETPLDVLSATRDQMRGLLADGMTCSDVGNERMERLGYDVNLHNSQDASSFVQLSFSCDVTVPQLGGKCLMSAPANSAASEELATVSLLLELCRTIVGCWDPDDGIVSCNALTEAIEPETMRFNSGWIIYRSSKHGSLPELPDTVRVEPVNSHGYLVVASEDITIPPTPNAIDSVRAVYRILGQAPKLYHT